MSAEEVTLGELARTLERMSGDVSRQFAELRQDVSNDVEKVERSIATLKFVGPDVYAADRRTDAEREKALVARVGKLEDAQTWLYRLVGSMIVTGVVGAILFGARVG